MHLFRVIFCLPVISPMLLLRCSHDCAKALLCDGRSCNPSNVDFLHLRCVSHLICSRKFFKLGTNLDVFELGEGTRRCRLLCCKTPWTLACATWKLYCSISFNSSGTVTRDAHDENMVSSGGWGECDRYKFSSGSRFFFKITSTSTSSCTLI